MESTGSLSRYLSVKVSKATPSFTTSFPDPSVLPIGSYNNCWLRMYNASWRMAPHSHSTNSKSALQFHLQRPCSTLLNQQLLGDTTFDVNSGSLHSGSLSFAINWISLSDEKFQTLCKHGWCLLRSWEQGKANLYQEHVWIQVQH